ncbi:MAG: hypothetical protein ACR2HG_09820 [Pyrinomonadaceae bacterium]
MSKFTVDLNAQEKENTETNFKTPTLFENQIAPKKPSVFFKILKFVGAALILFLIIGAIGGYFYWRHLKKTPQYSLALLVDAARRDDQKTIDELVDTDAVVDDFMPQITDKAVELYGRGLAPATIQKMAQVAAPLMPAIKQRARAEVPNLIREKTKAFEKFPFWTIAIGASNYLDITENDDKAFVKSKMPDRPLEVTLKRNGERWQVVAVKDEVLARRVAETIGKDLIVAAQKGGIKQAGEQLGVSNLEDILKRTKEIFK